MFRPNRRRISTRTRPRRTKRWRSFATGPSRKRRSFVNRTTRSRKPQRRRCRNGGGRRSRSPAETAERAEQRGWFGRLRAGLARSSARLNDGINTIFLRRRLDDEALAELEELLIASDMGVGIAGEVTEALRSTRFNQEVSPEEVRTALAEQVIRLIEPVTRPLRIDRARRPFVILVDRRQRQRQDDDDRQARQAIPRPGARASCSPPATPSAPPRSSNCRSGASGSARRW